MQEEIPPQVKECEKDPQGSQGAQGNQVRIVGGGDDPPKLSNWDIREALLGLAQVVTTQVNLSMLPRANVVEKTMTSRSRYYVRVNHPIFIGSKVGEVPQEFIDKV